jgi:putative intracellular protease/amidase
MRQKLRALVALTSHDRLGDTGRATGAYTPEVADAWQVFTAAGLEVDLVSVRGGEPPLDAVNRADPVQSAFFEQPGMAIRLTHTPTFAEVDPARYAIVFFAGGHGAAWDFPYDPDLAVVARTVYENGGVVGAVCHGPAALVNVTLSDGTHLVDGKRVGAFTNSEEKAVGMTDIVPFLLADKLEERGARHIAADSFIPHVVVDGRLVTGQNPSSAESTARACLEALQPETAVLQAIRTE